MIVHFGVGATDAAVDAADVVVSNVFDYLDPYFLEKDFELRTNKFCKYFTLVRQDWLRNNFAERFNQGGK